MQASELKQLASSKLDDPVVCRYKGRPSTFSDIVKLIWILCPVFHFYVSVANTADSNKPSFGAVRHPRSTTSHMLTVVQVETDAISIPKWLKKVEGIKQKFSDADMKNLDLAVKVSDYTSKPVDFILESRSMSKASNRSPTNAPDDSAREDLLNIVHKTLTKLL